MRETILGVKGMRCGMCEAHINDTIRKSFDVIKVNSSRKRNQVVILSKCPLDENRIKEVIAGTVYELIDINSREAEKKSLFRG